MKIRFVRKYVQCKFIPKEKKKQSTFEKYFSSIPNRNQRANTHKKKKETP